MGLCKHVFVSALSSCLRTNVLLVQEWQQCFNMCCSCTWWCSEVSNKSCNKTQSAWTGPVPPILPWWGAWELPEQKTEAFGWITLPLFKDETNDRLRTKDANLFAWTCWFFFCWLFWHYSVLPLVSVCTWVLVLQRHRNAVWPVCMNPAFQHSLILFLRASRVLAAHTGCVNTYSRAYTIELCNHRNEVHAQWGCDGESRRWKYIYVIL